MPHDGVSGRSVVLAIEIAAEFGDGQQIVGHVLLRRPLMLTGKLVENVISSW